MVVEHAGILLDLVGQPPAEGRHRVPRLRHHREPRRQGPAAGNYRRSGRGIVRSASRAASSLRRRRGPFLLSHIGGAAAPPSSRALRAALAASLAPDHDPGLHSARSPPRTRCGGFAGSSLPDTTARLAFASRVSCGAALRGGSAALPPHPLVQSSLHHRTACCPPPMPVTVPTRGSALAVALPLAQTAMQPMAPQMVSGMPIAAMSPGASLRDRARRARPGRLRRTRSGDCPRLCPRRPPLKRRGGSDPPGQPASNSRSSVHHQSGFRPARAGPGSHTPRIGDALREVMLSLDQSQTSHLIKTLGGSSQSPHFLPPPNP